ncbi:MAG: AI-2E family transporter [Bacteroidetes bacterium]|nr:AI-2E family transporter [Bacteroidota bacterium]
MPLKINIWRIIGLLAIVAFAILFFKIVIYLAISLVLFLVGYPITYKLEKIKFGKRHMPDTLSALITILLIVSVLFGLFFLIIPPLATEINFLAELNFNDVFHNILAQFPAIKSMLLKLGNEEDLKQNLSSQVSEYVNTKNVSMVLNNTFQYFGTIFGGMLCVLFITFFLLKDEKIVKNSLLTITPLGVENEMREVLKISKKMLSKYFVSLFIDMFIVGGSVFLFLTIFGIKNALIIAFCAGILNVIPYIGSAITMGIAIILGVSSCISTGNYELIGSTINTIFFTLLTINLIDGFIIQPFIFSNSVKAHPLEIFIVTLMAGTLGGIFGMVIALPVYTIIRIIASEFLTHLKFFRKISETITE